MKDDNGNIHSKVWLIADSPPVNYKNDLSYPLDPRHPAVHNIWTPVFDQINDILFDDGLRLDSNLLYVRNAVNDFDFWNDSKKRTNSIHQLKNDIKKYRPTVIITFGSKAYEAVRQAANNDEKMEFKKWSSEQLGIEFRNAILSFNIEKINILPLLHVSVCRRYFLKGQANFCDNNQDNYFTYTGNKIAKILSQEYFYDLCKKNLK